MASQTPKPTPWPTNYPIEVIAGSGKQGFQDGPALQASLYQPQRLCVDPRDGTIFIIDAHALRKLTPQGMLMTVAGGLEPGFQDGPAQAARFHWPMACVVTPQGHVYITDRGNRRLRLLSADGQVSTVLGTGEAGFQDGDRTQTKFSEFLNDLILTPSGTLYISDHFRIRRYVSPRIETLNYLEKGPWMAERGYAKEGNIHTTEGLFGRFIWMSLDKDENLFLADPDFKQIRKLDRQGNVTNFPLKLKNLPVDQSEEAPPFFQLPGGIAFDSKREMLFLNLDSQVFQTNLAGDTLLVAGYSLVQNDTTIPFRLISDGGISMGLDNNLYVLDSKSYQLKRVVLPPP